MKKSAFFGAFLFSLFLLLPGFTFAQEVSVKIEFNALSPSRSNFFSEFIVWTFENGPVSLGEYVGLFPAGEPFSVSEYDSSADDALWVEHLFRENNVFVVTVPENYEKISSELEKLELSGLPYESSGIDEISNAILKESAETKGLFEQNYLDEYENLAFYSYGEEGLSVQKSEGKTVVSKSDKKNAVRAFYDEQMRIQKKETWNVSAGFSWAKLKEIQEFFYEDSAKPYKSIVENDNKKHEILYDSKGQIIQSKNFSAVNSEIQEENQIQKTERKFVLTGKTEWKYSDSGKILEKYSEEYEYNAKQTRIKKTFSKKEVYEYKIKDGSPDYYYYENGNLRMSTVFSSSDSYISTMNFDDGFVVESYYENGIRKKDFLYSNGILRRTKVYEQ